MSIEIKPKFAEYIQGAYYVWLTTVRADGMPQPTPVWFLWDNDTFLIYSMPNTQKIRNIRQNNKVALNFNGDHEAEKYFVVMGEATFDPTVSPVHENQAYLTKYAQGITRIGWTPEHMASMFTTAIRVKPSQIRGE